MPEIVLNTSMSYLYDVKGTMINFRRGGVVDVPEGVYHDLIRTGYFGDPRRRCDPVAPRQLSAVPGGSEVPIFRDVGLGDVLMAAVPLRDLQAKHPRLRLVYGVHSHFVPLFRGSSFVKGGVRPIPSFVGTFPYVVDLRGYCERQEIGRRIDRTDVFSRHLLGGPPSSYETVLNPPATWLAQGRKIAGLSGSRPVVGYVPRASQSMRNWRAPQHRRFVDTAVAQGWTVVLLDRGTPKTDLGDGDRVRDLRGRISILDLAKVVKACDVVVTPDTGTLHLAEALGTRWVGYFTSVSPRLRVGYYRWGRALYPEGRLACLGCHYSPSCKERNPTPCAALTTPEQAWREVELVYSSDPPWNPFAWETAGEPDGRRGSGATEAAEVLML